MDAIYRLLDSLGVTDPVHPMWTHIPIGLVIGSLTFALAAFFLGEGLRKTARQCLIAALVFTVVTIVFGVLDWRYFFDGAWFYPFRAKLILGLVLVAFLLAAVILGRRQRRPTLIFVLTILCFFDVVALGYYGGRLTFDGRLPDTQPALPAGRAVFRSHCLGCHPQGGNIFAPRAPIRGSDHVDNPEVFTRWVRGPRPPMPAFSPEKINDEEVKALYDYVRAAFKTDKAF